MKIQIHTKSDYLDAGGAAVSVLCALHCALLPSVVALLPLVGLGLFASDAVEWGLIALSAMLGMSSLSLGYREHRSRRALGVLAVGLGVLAAGCISEHREISEFGVPLVVAGGLLIAVSHGINHWLCRTCRACRQHKDVSHDGSCQWRRNESAAA